ncbi:hypothetical protein CYLTODRAFT_423485 [Cylindrobasidium torrendii FP15055 ss-10]|uniref:F-box domain-containing protein n=1 Tax=Cylindrobasidium torrendii FP15055 ss-10 TaxID=1314674 RepID=A0A0D7B897_9AGAR|nr:hypothetical protein CYLTODRAFT_423485 [Cylindrobasidium torrendii FP15055 ss-10]
MSVSRATIHDLPAEIIAIILSYGQRTGVHPKREDAMACVRYACAVSQVSRFWRSITLNVEPAKLIWSYIVEFTHGDFPTSIGSLFVKRTKHRLHYFLIQNRPEEMSEPTLLVDIAHRVQCISLYALQLQLPDQRLLEWTTDAGRRLEYFTFTVPDYSKPSSGFPVLFDESKIRRRKFDLQLFGYPISSTPNILPTSLTRLTLERSYVSLHALLTECSKTLEILVLRGVVNLDSGTRGPFKLHRLVYLELGGSHSNLPQCVQTPWLGCVLLTGRWNAAEILNFRWRYGAPKSVERLVYAMDDMTQGGQYHLLNAILIDAFPCVEDIQWCGDVRPLLALLQRTAIRTGPRGARTVGLPMLKSLTVSDLFKSYDDVKELLLWRLGEGFPFRSIGYRAADEEAADAIVASYPANIEQELCYDWYK